VQVDEGAGQRADKPGQSDDHQPDSRSALRSPQPSRRAEGEQQDPDCQIKERECESLRCPGDDLGADTEHGADDRERDRQPEITPARHHPRGPRPHRPTARPWR
jgi:hypothetical protein